MNALPDPPTPLPPRRRASDHPRRRLEDAPAHRRLLHIIIAGLIIGALALLLAWSELRSRDNATGTDLAEVRAVAEQVARAEAAAATDMRAHRIRTEELLGRICQILVSTHDGITPADCPTPLAHPSDPGQPADTPRETP